MFSALMIRLVSILEFCMYVCFCNVLRFACVMFAAWFSTNVLPIALFKVFVDIFALLIMLLLLFALLGV